MDACLTFGMYCVSLLVGWCGFAEPGGHVVRSTFHGFRGHLKGGRRSFLSGARRASAKEVLQQIVEEQLALGGGYQARRIGLQQALAFGCAACLLELLQRQAGALSE